MLYVCNILSLLFREQIAAMNAAQAFRVGPEPALPPGYARDQQLLAWEAMASEARVEANRTQDVADHASAIVEECRIKLKNLDDELTIAEQSREQKENCDPRC